MPPFEVIVAPKVADVFVILLTVGVVNKGAVEDVVAIAALGLDHKDAPCVFTAATL